MKILYGYQTNNLTSSSIPKDIAEQVYIDWLVLCESGFASLDTDNLPATIPNLSLHQASHRELPSLFSKYTKEQLYYHPIGLTDKGRKLIDSHFSSLIGDNDLAKSFFNHYR